VEESVTHIFNITDSIGAIVTGNLNDGKAMITRLRYEAAQFKFDNGYHMPVPTMAAKYSEITQLSTQYIGIRAMCVVLTIVGIDEVKGPQVFKIDPAGFSLGYSAIAAGAKEQEAINHLERLQKKEKDSEISTDAAIQKAIITLQNVVGSDFKNNEIEIGIATDEKPRFKKLTKDEIETHLNVIADED